MQEKSDQKRSCRNNMEHHYSVTYEKYL
uniref:Uncharacterized protein n=1 Tax=Anguilla anguilla TaxID=7936 RepID=A0A0E9RCB4_ANGAN